MVPETLVRRGIDPEAFPLGVIIIIHLLSGPVVAFDAEVVVALDRQFRLPVTGLQQALCQCNAGRHAAPVHFPYSRGRVLPDIILLRGDSCERRHDQG